MCSIFSILSLTARTPGFGLFLRSWASGCWRDRSGGQKRSVVTDGPILSSFSTVSIAHCLKKAATGVINLGSLTISSISDHIKLSDREIQLKFWLHVLSKTLSWIIFVTTFFAIKNEKSSIQSIPAQYTSVKPLQMISLFRFVDMLLIASRWAASTADFSSTWIKDLSSFILILGKRNAVLMKVTWIQFLLFSTYILSWEFHPNVCPSIRLCCVCSGNGMMAGRSRTSVHYLLAGRTVSMKCSYELTFFENHFHRYKLIDRHYLFVLLNFSIKVDVSGYTEKQSVVCQSTGQFLFWKPVYDYSSYTKWY